MIDRLKLMALILLWVVTAYVHLGPTSTAQSRSDMEIDALLDHVNSADRIVRGTVTSVTSRYASADTGDHFITSTIEITVAETLKGTKSTSATVQMIGGTVGGVTMGSSEFESVPAKGASVMAMTARNIVIPHGLLRLNASGETVDSHITVAQIRAALQGKL